MPAIKKLLLLLCLPSFALAEDVGRVQLSGAAVTSNLGIVSGDALLPLLHQANGFVYGDVMGSRATNDTYAISPGLGFRTIKNNQLWGAYFFTDYEKTSLGENFWNLSPGVEWATAQWDAHANAYFPTNTQHQCGSTDFASNFGNNDYVAFEEGTTNQYDELQTPYAVIGNGVDTEIGYSFDANHNHLRSRVALGGYYYQAPSHTSVDNITGVTFKISQALSTSTSVSLFNSYDEVSGYNVGVSVAMTFGGDSNTFSNDVSDRLYDTVDRHIGIIDTGAANIDQEDYVNQGMALQYDNVRFAAPVAQGSGDGTYGNAMALTQENLDSIEGDARIYVQGGSDATYSNLSTLTVSDGQDFYGRTEDYKAPAESNAQPTLLFDDDGFVVQGGENTFSDLTVSAETSGAGTGISATNTGADNETLTIENTTVSGFNTGVSVNNSSTGIFTLNLNNAYLINNSGSGSGMTVFGLNATNSGSGTLNINAIQSYFNSNSVDGDAAQVAGMNVLNQANGQVNVTLQDSQFNDNSATGSGNTLATGLYVQNNTDGNIIINADSTQFNNNTSSNTALGADFVNQQSGSINAAFSDSEFNNNAGGYAGVGLYAINHASGAITVSDVNSQFANNTGDYGYGIYAKNLSTGSISFANINPYMTGNSTANSYP